MLLDQLPFMLEQRQRKTLPRLVVSDIQLVSPSTGHTCSKRLLLCACPVEGQQRQTHAKGFKLGPAETKEFQIKPGSNIPQYPTVFGLKVAITI